MKVIAIYDNKNNFVAAFKDRETAVNYGISVFGADKGWEYTLKEMWMGEAPQPKHIPFTPSQPITTPYTPPITLLEPPYSPNIWCGDGSGPKATFME